MMLDDKREMSYNLTTYQGVRRSFAFTGKIQTVTHNNQISVCVECPRYAALANPDR